MRAPVVEMPEAEIWEELEALNINVQAGMQLRSKRRDWNPKRTVPCYHTSLYRLRKALMWRKCNLSQNPAACE
jgi:hypothetical protein